MSNILVIDNYDSFTYNLVHLIGSIDPDIEVHRNDKITLEEIAEKMPKAIILSPGPKTPDEAGICLDVVARFGGEIPIFGVCLGHQSIGQNFGAKVVRASRLMHGKTSKVRHNGEGIFKGLNSDGIVSTRYHSLTLDPDTIGDNLDVTAKSDDGMIMAVAHKTLPIHSVQFHPESIASESGTQMIANFLELAAEFNNSPKKS
ncbi:anthranilate synthase component II [Maritalea myrionectae]|uniref:anthranilate synthase component II n=1 Tax=Maritalea myrionectae TaxID=454601 RepID=UPI0003F5A4BD|nr:aminodeoxychorismate/anthranilate synthase component II [Maritalea myrionectae]